MREFYMIRYTVPATSYWDYSTTADVAEWLGVSPRALRDWRRRGKGPKYELRGSKFLYRRQYIEDYIDDICVYLGSGRATGLIPFEGTKLEPVIRQWIEAAAGDSSNYCLSPKSSNRTAAALLVERRNG